MFLAQIAFFSRLRLKQFKQWTGGSSNVSNVKPILTLLNFLIINLAVTNKKNVKKDN